MVQIFYGLGVSLMLPLLPNAADAQVVMFTNGFGQQQLGTMKDAVQTGMQSQVNIPFLDFGSLVFYSSVTAFNFFMNAFTAIPQILTVLCNGIFMFIPVPPSLQIGISIFLIGFLTVVYYLALFIFIISARSPTYGGIR